MQRVLPAVAMLWVFVLPMCVDLTFCWTELRDIGEGDATLYRYAGFSRGSVVVISGFASVPEGWSAAVHGPKLGALYCGAGPDWGGMLVPSWLVVAFAWFVFQYLVVGLSAARRYPVQRDQRARLE